MAIRGGRRGPDSVQIGTEREDLRFLFLGQRAWTLSFPPFEFRFCSGEIAQALFLLGFKAACYESGVGFNGTALTLGAFSFVASTFHRQAPLTKRRIVVPFQLLCGQLRRFQGRGCQRFEESINNCLIDLDAADVGIVHSVPLNDILAGAMIARRRVSAAIMGVQPAATLSARGRAAIVARAEALRIR
jgi:hypothetical protein